MWRTFVKPTPRPYVCLARRSLARPPIGACPIGRSNDYSHSTSGGGDTPPLAPGMASPMAGCPMLRDGGASAFARAQAQVHTKRKSFKEGQTAHYAHVPVGLMHNSSYIGSVQRKHVQEARTQGFVLEQLSRRAPFHPASLQCHEREV